MWTFQDQVFVLYVIGLGISAAVIYNPSFFWDPRNPAFQTNAGMKVQMSSKLNLICPHYAMVLQQQESHIPWQRMFENLWIVDKNSYDSCTVDTSVAGNQKVFDCSSPLTTSFYPVVFQQYSAVPDGLVFQRGHTYYFIATSDGTNSSLSSTTGGHCQSANMKLTIYVCANSSDSKCSGNRKSVSKSAIPSVYASQTFGVSYSISQVTSSSYSNSLLENSTPAATPSTAVQSSSEPTLTSSTAVQSSRASALASSTAVQSSSVPAVSSSSVVQVISPSSSALAPTSSSVGYCPALSIPDSLSAEVANQSNLLNRILNYTTMIPELLSLLQSLTNGSKAEGNCISTEKPPVLADCLELYQMGYTATGVYRIQPQPDGDAFGVYCDQESNGGGWTVLLNRFDGNLGFNKAFAQYNEGFGDLTGEVWLGLHRFKALCYNTVTIRFDLENEHGESRYAEYAGCSLGDKGTKYEISIPNGSYTGDAGDSFTRQNGMKFSTKDVDKDLNPSRQCAKEARGGWWFRDCEETCLTGYHRNGSYPLSDWGVGILWPTFNTSALIRVSMKIRPT